jgi:polysaccharide export outer membrane protein
MTFFKTLPVLASLAVGSWAPLSAAAQAYAADAAAQPATAVAAASGYQIGPLDELDVNVFQVPDLTRTVQVDASGMLLLPLVGEVQARGKTPGELARLIETRLEKDYLHDAQVSVAVKTASSLTVTVDGAVVEPGVYSLKGPTTLMQAVALAKGPDSRIANLKKVAVFRDVGGYRVSNIYDLKAIRAGQAKDPIIQGKDIIVVETSGAKGFFRDFISALPIVSAFRPY